MFSTYRDSQTLVLWGLPKCDPSLDIIDFGVPVPLDQDLQEEDACTPTGNGAVMFVRRSGCGFLRSRLVLVRPSYLLREFPLIFLTVVYSHPKADAKSAVDTQFAVHLS